MLLISLFENNSFSQHLQNHCFGLSFPCRLNFRAQLNVMEAAMLVLSASFKYKEGGECAQVCA